MTQINTRNIRGDEFSGAYVEQNPLICKASRLNSIVVQLNTVFIFLVADFATKQSGILQRAKCQIRIVPIDPFLCFFHIHQTLLLKKCGDVLGIHGDDLAQLQYISRPTLRRNYITARLAIRLVTVMSGQIALKLIDQLLNNRDNNLRDNLEGRIGSTSGSKERNDRQNERGNRLKSGTPESYHALDKRLLTSILKGPSVGFL